MTENNEKIYILLMRSRTFISKIIGKVTKGTYTHSSLSFDKECTEMYSFARIYRRFAFPGGFIRENIDKGVIRKCRKEPCLLFELNINRDTYEKVRSEVASFKNAKKRPAYDYLGALRVFRGKPHENSRRYFCSRFVAQVLGLAGAISLKKPASLYMPDDFLEQTELKPVYQGDFQGLRSFVNRETSPVAR